MSIPEETLSAIKSRVDIVDLVREYLPLKKVGANYSACCPFHEERTPSFTVTDKKGFYHCFGCGAHGDQIDWLVNYLGMPWHEAVARLAEKAGLSLPDNEDSERVRAKNRASKVLTKAAKWMHKRLMVTDHALRYVIEERKVSPELAELFMIGWSPKAAQDYLSEFSSEELDVLIQAGLLGKAHDGRIYPKLGGRVIFPIVDAMGLVIGFSGRAMGDAIPKYMNSPDSPFFSKRNELFRPPEVRREARRAGRVIVTEGYFDVIALHAAGFPNAVAGMGTATTPENMETMFSLAGELVFCFDGDKAGRIAAWKALIAAFPFIGSNKDWKGNRLVSFVFLPNGLDPDDFISGHGREGFSRLLDTAVPLSEFFVESYRKKRSVEPMEKHTAIMTQAARQISQIKDDVLKNGLASSIASVFDVSVDAVRKAGGFSLRAANSAISRRTVPTVRPDSLESAFLATILRRPWDASLLPGDVDLVMPGGTEIVSILRAAGITDGQEFLAKDLFSGTPYLPLVERLLASEDVDDDARINALRLELAWVGRRLDTSMKASTPDPSVLRQLLARKVAVQGRLEQLTGCAASPAVQASCHAPSRVPHVYWE
jgi:DNA primase